ncbi:MAG TPA: protein kinase [Gemmatimonadales bacterium]|nr:protein kinase [Gemmatimonadales bacterium]
MLDQLRATLADRYALDRELGEGGMSLVYLARDLRHDRAVALKVLRPELSAVVGADRFLNEIRVTANLQHAHILPLFDSGVADGLLYYVMPYVEGESLRSRLTRDRQLPIGEAVRLTSQVASALEYAHRRGVLHRDIKPENILLQEGQALVADFGIALALRKAGGARLTSTGLTVGTPQYMSPEQAAGDRDLDPRSDVYSLASVLYEMLAGEPPFTGPTVQAILTKLVTEHPRPVREVRDTISPALEALLQQALARLPADRFSGAGEFAEALARAPQTVTPTEAVAAAVPSSRRVRSTPAWLLLVTAAIALGSFAGWRLGRSRSEARIIRLTVPTLSLQVDPALRMDPTFAIGPSGKDLIFRNSELLYLRTLDDFTPRPLAGTEGASMPAFSPDGKWVAFYQSGHLRKLALTGGTAVEIATADLGPGLTWGEDGRIYFSSLGGNGGIWRVPVIGGTPEPVTQVSDSAGEYVHAWPQLLPGGKDLLFTVVGPSSGALDSRIVVEAVGSGPRRTLAEHATFGRYLPSGQLLYVTNEGTVFAAAYDRRKRTVVGTPQAVLSDVYVSVWGGAALLTVAEDGTLAFQPGITGPLQVVRTVDRSGRDLGGIQPAGDVDGIRLSPDGRRIAANVRAPSKNGIWLFGPEGEPERLTFEEAEAEFPVWSPDGRMIAYTSALASQARQLQIREVAAGTRPRRILTWPRHLHLSSWSPDGKWLAGYDVNPTRGQDVWAIAADGSDSIPVAAGPASEAQPDFSPDGRWVAYQSDASGRFEIFIISFPDLAVKRQISTNGGQAPRWDPAGGMLYYLEGDRLWAVPMSLSSGLRLGTGQVLFQTRARAFDVAPGGKRFILVLPNPELSPPGIQVVLDWIRELQDKLSRSP